MSLDHFTDEVRWTQLHHQGRISLDLARGAIWALKGIDPEEELRRIEEEHNG